MVLLTSSSISVAISSSIIGLFTFLLFLSGYVLQQQSVRSIQAVLHPPTRSNKPAIQLSPTLQTTVAVAANIKSADSTRVVSSTSGDAIGTSLPAGKVAKPFGNPPNGAGSNQEVLLDADDTPTNKYAYIQLISKPSAADICSSLLFFTTLASKTPNLDTDLLFLYPKSWDSSSPTKSVSLALDRLRQSHADITLHAIDMANPRDRSPSDIRLLSKASSKLSRYERVFHLHSPGMLLDAEKLNTLLSSPLEDADKSDKNNKGATMPWSPTRLSVSETQLPPAFLATSRHLPSGATSVQSYVLAPIVRESFVAPASYRHTSSSDPNVLPQPAYVFFEKGRRRKVEVETMYFQEWKDGVQQVCSGIDLDD
ncbi:hypothetical protein AJ80_05094 [Polytolypa hystricis UAMH7299]|uniref:Uncharacterized protein n=1 Tax=Polytolypa hystricis (strain UAMH7299) TaxID=1447883 RepID=A0A2B7Y6P8_POLH7|nr:hypothetical protein AJ80_05094 [Polytolypa hystricis UAMH7299]